MDSTRAQIIVGLVFGMLLAIASATIGFALGRLTSPKHGEVADQASLLNEKRADGDEKPSELSDADRKSIESIIRSIPDRHETEEEKLAYAFKKAAISLSIGQETFQPTIAEELINRHLASFEFNRESQSLTRYEGQSVGDGFARVRVNVAPIVRDVLLCYTHEIHERNVSHYLDSVGNGFGESGIGERVT